MVNRPNDAIRKILNIIKNFVSRSETNEDKSNSSCPCKKILPTKGGFFH
tara:strand:- start:1387 stop:1533 length:147 start_codon:yes stop_codon:yes gene_type:complete